jgi:hypothetical protein
MKGVKAKMHNLETVPIKVEHIKEEMRVDLESCPYLSDHPSAPYEYATVDYVKRETADCIAISYEGIDVVGYPLGTVLQIRKD